MLIGIPKELDPERRVSIIPTSIEKLSKMGFTFQFETGLGHSIGLDDDAFQKVGAKKTDRAQILADSDIILRINKPPLEEITAMKVGAIHISFLDPFQDKEHIHSLAKHKIKTISLQMIPRSTFAQKMDALSSQANLAGYVAVIIAAEHSNKIFPMMMTPAGTITPSRVFIIGAGVAGLQAIATAKRLGARVEAFDTRPVVAEQVQSLGAKFIKIDMGETGQTKDGYAKQLTEEQLQKQRDGMAKACAQADVVITTAQVFGKKAPRILTKDMIEQMKPESIIIDMAIDSGGNVEGAKLNEEVVHNGVRILGYSNLPGRVAFNASQMFSNNLMHFLDTFTDKETKAFHLDTEHEIIQGCLITADGSIVHPKIKETLSA